MDALIKAFLPVEKFAFCSSLVQYRNRRRAAEPLAEKPRIGESAFRHRGKSQKPRFYRVGIGKLCVVKGLPNSLNMGS